MDSARGIFLFETRLGVCGIAWAGGQIVGAQLPEANAATTRARLGRRLPDLSDSAPPTFVFAAISLIETLLATGRGDLSGLPLDMTGLPDFDVTVWAECRAIPAGQTRSYGEIARALGDVGLSRRVGQALGRNPFAPIIPCHRVLGANGKAGGFSGGAGVETKLRLLNLEQASTGGAPGLFSSLPLSVKPVA